MLEGSVCLQFRKDCIISFNNVIKSETVQVCIEEVKRSCDLPGREVCETLYDTGKYFQSSFNFMPVFFSIFYTPVLTVCETCYKRIQVVEKDAECKVVRQPWCAPDTPEDEKQNCPTIPIKICPKGEEKSVKVCRPSMQ